MPYLFQVFLQSWSIRFIIVRKTEINVSWMPERICREHGFSPQSGRVNIISGEHTRQDRAVKIVCQKNIYISHII